MASISSSSIRRGRAARLPGVRGSTTYMSKMPIQHQLRHIARVYGSICNSYHTIPNYDLFRLPVKDLLASEVALVALWVTNRPRFIEFAQTDLFAAWGLTPVARWFWMKVLPREQEAASVLEVTCAHGASAAQSLGPPQDDGQVRAGPDPARPRTPPVRGAADRRTEPIGGGGAR